MTIPKTAAPSLRQAVQSYLAIIRSGWRPWVFGSLLVLANGAVYWGTQPLIEIQHERPDLYRTLMAQAPFPELPAETRRTFGFIVCTAAMLLLIALPPVLGWWSRRVVAWFRGRVAR